MARRSYKKRYYKRRSRWSSNINNISSGFNIPANSTGFGNIVLQQNPAQNSATVSQPYTIKNVEMSFEMESSSVDSNILEDIQIFIIYVPQGMVVTETLPFNHPEYIMAYKFYGSPVVDGSPYKDTVFIKTRLSRILQTGDSVNLLIVAKNQATNVGSNLNVSGLVRYWTKAN